ncbi:hypothetical protein Poly24_11490 [Rosistilla carotiformis]|uniref:Uncharacterized protein n=1 Tax=Rosistilla carotiformis TaxID=2528017 RepID=A0A518JPH4_9BACT|nr:hypothetical protein Poly24_11490 [Rosistilla carotiformis]
MNELNESDRHRQAFIRPRAGTLSRIVHRSVLAVMAILLSSSISGCANFQGVASSCDCSVNRSLHMTRAQLMARRVWSQKHASCYANHCNTLAVRRGFIDGFVDVASGKDGCPPVFPPQNQCCLVGAFRSPENNCRDQAWFEGYPLGVIAAEQQGCHLWWRSTMPAHLIAQYQPANNCSATSPACGPAGSVIDPSPEVATSVARVAGESAASNRVTRHFADPAVDVPASAKFTPIPTQTRLVPVSVAAPQRPVGSALQSPPLQSSTPIPLALPVLRDIPSPSNGDARDRVHAQHDVVSEARPTLKQTSFGIQQNAKAHPSLGLIPSDSPNDAPLSEVIRTSVRWSQVPGLSN